MPEKYSNKLGGSKKIRKGFLEFSIKDWEALGGQHKVCLGIQVVAEYDWLVS